MSSKFAEAVQMICPHCQKEVFIDMYNVVESWDEAEGKADHTCPECRQVIFKVWYS
jgi:DNA-directed RNA polymerase subunit RPC12/RpoP